VTSIEVRDRKEDSGQLQELVALRDASELHPLLTCARPGKGILGVIL
jgi:hypothetical protein